MIPLTVFNSRIPMSREIFNSTIAKEIDSFKTYLIGDPNCHNPFKLKAYDTGDAFYLYSPSSQHLFHANNLTEIEEIISLLWLEWTIKYGPDLDHPNYTCN